MSFTTIIYAHPYDQSFNHGILRRVQQLLDEKGEKYRLIDLYADGFNPSYTKEELALFNQGKALDPLVLHYQELLKTTNRLIFIFPIWWADMPAIVKGFEDKVFLKTFAYVPTATGLKGNLSHIKEALVISTSTAPHMVSEMVWRQRHRQSDGGTHAQRHRYRQTPVAQLRQYGQIHRRTAAGVFGRFEPKRVIFRRSLTSPPNFRRRQTRSHPLQNCPSG